MEHSHSGFPKRPVAAERSNSSCCCLKDRCERPPAVRRCKSRELPPAEEQSLPPVHAGEKWPTGPKRQLNDMAQRKRMGSIKSRRPVLACNVVWSKFLRVVAGSWRFAVRILCRPLVDLG